MAIVCYAAIKLGKQQWAKMTWHTPCFVWGTFQFTKRKTIYQAVTGYHASTMVACYKIAQGTAGMDTDWGWGGRRQEEAKDKPCKLNYEMHRMRYHPDNKSGAEVLYAPLWENVCATLLMGKERSKSTHTASPWNELGPICFKIQ